MPGLSNPRSLNVGRGGMQIVWANWISEMWPTAHKTHVTRDIILHIVSRYFFIKRVTIARAHVAQPQEDHPVKRGKDTDTAAAAAAVDQEVSKYGAAGGQDKCNMYIRWECARYRQQVRKGGDCWLGGCCWGSVRTHKLPLITNRNILGIHFNYSKLPATDGRGSCELNGFRSS